MSSNKGGELNKRVWELFSRAGFDTQPNSSDPNEKEVTIAGKKRTLDLLAKDEALGIKIIGWNKSGANKDVSFSTHVNDYAVIKKHLKADAVLYVSTGYELLADDIAYAKTKGDSVWNKDQLEYYEAIVNAVGKWAKYEIIHALGIKTREEKTTFTVSAIKLTQPNSQSKTELFLFSIPAEKLLKTCSIYRRAQGDANAYQRMLSFKRLPKIAGFLGQPDSLLPTNIVLHLGPNINVREISLPKKDTSGGVINFSRADVSLVALDIPLEYASMEIIDGQHRIYAFTQTEEKIHKGYNVLVTGLQHLEDSQKRDAFIAINDNSRRMDPNLVAYLKYTTDDVACQNDPELMAIRLVVELNKKAPFNKSIRLLDTGKERITLKGFAGYDLKGLMGTRGLLRKYYVDNTAKEYGSALQMYFSTIQSEFKTEWANPNKYIIATNRGISAFLKLIKSMLRTNEGPLDHDTIKRYLAPLKKHQTWEYAKLQQNYTGSQGWKKFHKDLVANIKKDIPTFKE